MSDTLQRTIASIPKLFSSQLGASTVTDSDQVSSGMFSFIKNLSATKSKYQEEQIVQRELTLQRQKLAQPTQTTAQNRDSLLRIFYCHLLGYDTTFAFIHAIKLAQQGTMLEKRVGYLICGLFFDEDHELAMLLINTIQRDLKSTNIIEEYTALIACCHLVNSDMIPALLPSVIEKLKHSKDLVRKKAVLCLHSFLLKVPSLLTQLYPYFRSALADKDPGVVWVTIEVYRHLIKDNPSDYVDLVPVWVDIAEQVTSRKLSTVFDYHTVPAPWLVISILKLLSSVVAKRQSSSRLVHPLLQMILQRTEPSHKVGLALIYETLITISTIEKDDALITLATKCVARFLSAKQINLKYIGMKVLTNLVSVDAKYALEHQDVVMDCLEHHDPAIRKTTLELLYKMANKVNKDAICARLLDHAATSNDKFTRSNIFAKVVEIIERFAGQNQTWFVEKMFSVLSVAGDGAPAFSSEKLIDVILHGFKNSKQDVTEGQLHALHLSWNFMKRLEIPAPLLKVVIWVVGEYFFLDEDLIPSEAVSFLVDCYTRCETDANRKSIITSLCKLSRFIDDPIATCEMMKRVSGPRNKEIHQRLGELEKLCQSNVPTEGLNSNEKFDFSLSFLDAFVSRALESGSSPYRTITLRKPVLNSIMAADLAQVCRGSDELIFAPDSPSIRQPSSDPTLFNSLIRSREDTSESVSRSTDSGDQTGLTLPKRSIPTVWTQDGIVSENSNERSRSFPDNVVPRALKENVRNSSKQPEINLERRNLAAALFEGIEDKQMASESSSMNNPACDILPLEASDDSTQHAVNVRDRSISPDSIESSDEQSDFIDTPLEMLLNSEYFDSSLSGKNSTFSSSANETSHQSKSMNLSKSCQEIGQLKDLGPSLVISKSTDLSTLFDSQTKDHELISGSIGSISDELLAEAISEHFTSNDCFPRTEIKTHDISAENDSFLKSPSSDFEILDHQDSLDETVSCISGTSESNVSRTFDSNISGRFDAARYAPNKFIEGDILRKGGLSIGSRKCCKDHCLQISLIVSKDEEFEADLDGSFIEILPINVFKVKFIESTSDTRCSIGDHLSSGMPSPAEITLEVSLLPEHPESFDSNAAVFLQLNSPKRFEAEFAISLRFLDFVRPYKMSVEEFSNLWISSSAEVKQSIQFTQGDRDFTLDQIIRGAMKNESHLHRVELSEKEGLLAGQILDVAESYFLIHVTLINNAQLQQHKLHVWLKGDSTRSLHQLLQNISQNITISINVQ